MFGLPVLQRLERHGSVPVARHQSWVVHRSTCVARSTPKRDVTKPRSRTAAQARFLKRQLSLPVSMAGTQSWCSTRGCRSMPTPAAYIAIPSIRALFGSRENCLVFSAAASSECCRFERPEYHGMQSISDLSGALEPYIWWRQAP